MNEVYSQTEAPAAPAGSEGASGAGFGGLLPILILWGAVLYLFFIRPQKKKEKERKAQLDNLKKKDEVITVGGIMGRIEGIIDDVVSLRIADDIVIRVQRTAISRIVTGDEPVADKK